MFSNLKNGGKVLPQVWLNPDSSKKETDLEFKTVLQSTFNYLYTVSFAQSSLGFSSASAFSWGCWMHERNQKLWNPTITSSPDLTVFSLPGLHCACMVSSTAKVNIDNGFLFPVVTKMKILESQKNSVHEC